MRSRSALALLVAVAASIWGQAAARAEPPPDRPALHARDHADVLYNGTWYPATVLSEPAAGFWQISYDGYGPEWNDVVGFDRIRRQGAAGAAPTDPLATSKPARTVRQLWVGMHVLVQWSDRWWAASVLAVLPDGRAMITYDGYGSGWDESVGLDRVRLPIREAH